MPPSASPPAAFLVGPRPEPPPLSASPLAASPAGRLLLRSRAATPPPRSRSGPARPWPGLALRAASAPLTVANPSPGHLLHLGSCGTVYHAQWYGSDVADKVFSMQEYSEEMINTFRQECEEACGGARREWAVAAVALSCASPPLALAPPTS
ncbi:hypothetical protein U9M48_028907 [Paspalum notatum var. saurae]|uniref:Uncharacterized protein n=1 Tax=Paspalum notatum var. saurae TaxID=547442 RepID=A0AAQ3TXN2_PASNO